MSGKRTKAMRKQFISEADNENRADSFRSFKRGGFNWEALQEALLSRRAAKLAHDERTDLPSPPWVPNPTTGKDKRAGNFSHHQPKPAGVRQP